MKFRLIYKGEVVKEWTEFRDWCGMEPKSKDEGYDWVLSDEVSQLDVEVTE